MWRDVPGWEHRYEACDNGDIRNKETGHLIVGDTNTSGYNRVTFYDGDRIERYFRHRVIASIFIPNPNNYTEVNHIDGNKFNNSASNLEWVTRKMNERHCYKNNLKTQRPFFVYFENGNLVRYEFATDLAQELGIDRYWVYNWLNGRSKTYLGFGIKDIYYDVLKA